MAKYNHKLLMKTRLFLLLEHSNKHDTYYTIQLSAIARKNHSVFDGFREFFTTKRVTFDRNGVWKTTDRTDAEHMFNWAILAYS